MEDTVSTSRHPPAGADSATRADPADESAREDAVETETTPALVVDAVSKRFGSDADAVLAVDDVSFSVERGSVVGLLGPNGAGKTTLIKSILGIVLPDRGSIHVLGTDVSAGRRGVYADVDAMLEGARNDYWRLTVRENLRYFATISGVDPDSVAARHDRLLDRLGLSEKAETPVRELSRGMKQKVSLASVLAGGAELVFLDEPTLGLDIESSRTLRTELRRLASEDGLTIVISSHDMTVIEDVCDRVIVMSDGRVVADDTIDALLRQADSNTVRITSSDLTEDAIASLRAQFDIRDIVWNSDHAHVEIGATGEELYTLMDALRAAGVTLDHVRTVEPDLEDVFVGLTGDTSGLVGSQTESRWST